MASKLPCPTCGKQISWSEQFPFRPFCCKRCQLIDLGEWANENNVIPASDNADEYELAIYNDPLNPDPKNY